MAMDIDISALEVAELEQLRDAINRRLLTLRRSPAARLEQLLALFEQTKRALEDQGKEWYSLERWQWLDGSLRFWLNPKDQERYRAGWFTIDELIAWAHHAGPIMREDDLELPEDEDDTVLMGPVDWAP